MSFMPDPAELVLLIVGVLLTIGVTALFVVIIRRAMKDEQK